MDWSSQAKECSNISARIIATYYAIVTFAAVLFVGMVAGSAASIVLLRAILLMVVAWFVGEIVSRIAAYGRRTHQTVQATESYSFRVFR